MTMFSLILKITIYRAIGTPSHGKDVLGGSNTRDKRFMRVKIISYQKLTTTCEYLVMLRYYSTKPPVSFSEQFKEIFNRIFSYCR